MMNIKALLTRGVRNLIDVTKISSSRSFYCSLSSTSCSSASRTSSGVVSDASTAAAGVDDVAEEEEDQDLVYSDTVASSILKPAIPTLLQPRVVVYDGVCHLCHRGVKWVIEADKYRKIKFCCLQSKAAEPYLSLCGVDREDVLRRFLFIEGPGLYHQASTAALRVMSYLPLPYSALSTLMVVPTPLRDAVYDYVAKRRYDWFGKSEDCLVLREQELLERFIDREEMMDRSRSDL
ncbi:hypothetical protein I3843_06G069700 [Carya illinoinensis]|uniref:Thiol-disulfide oxidoreductase DCC n=1 Tax=Carya illinoinensis TaxID=32201 RepID=A0A922JK96_CARIL|nr:uncharacterized protein YuxK [Carya illinoinensis]KAG2702133.1 hypothetical protein I3760_06G076200 [Carya illinoinensis]KAG6708322.1 hypothetical protein I3842_06G075400 [Carya illinoinensis]KAG6708327.1 hypothetical protein I3842_06G075800 [Carya illinoinensis]KAG7974875.1 hypothetical protein I3843_06G069700 [Carya illinoinensis]